MSWIEFTCGECGNKYTEQTGDTDERVCDECLNHEDEMADYGPPYSMANPTGEPVGSQPYPKWNDKAKEYDYPLKRRIEVEITYEGEEE